MEQIAAYRSLTSGTILGHFAEGLQAGERFDLSSLFTLEEKRQVAAAFKRIGPGNSTGEFESLCGPFDYGRLRLARAALAAAGKA